MKKKNKKTLIVVKNPFQLSLDLTLRLCDISAKLFSACSNVLYKKCS